MNSFSNKYIVEFNENHGEFTIDFVKKIDDCMPLVVIKTEDLKEMNLKQASEFIGERLILLMPALRKIYEDYLWSEDGDSPKKG
ncbi:MULTISPECIES: hypothetical protein [unclassified Simplicispira]|uniref:hypothetical protein n=1 Tax=unclassified Simplicispira TaxID=2630407 RepID=UPI000D5D9FA9|nr:MULTISPECIES: hypothetical protein [unclassified Simplicispira]PVY56318.1 hypothetical protein C8D04_1572 [Simplicispira sp. 125]REG17263.1 hypothetical protein C8D01_1882 [Simplicispira sp. 110]